MDCSKKFSKQESMWKLLLKVYDEHCTVIDRFGNDVRHVCMYDMYVLTCMTICTGIDRFGNDVRPTPDIDRATF